jgi:N-acetylmuramoyl-L-alanine amidase
MTELFLIAAALAASPISVRVIPRFDGLLFELSSPEPIAAAVDVAGYEVDIRTSAVIHLPESAAPFWILGWEADIDSMGFSVEVGADIDSLMFAFSPDSLVMLLFLRAGEPMTFPELSWNGPPEEPSPALLMGIPDSVTIAAMEMGRQSPWLSRFDRIVIDPGHGGRDPGAVGQGASQEKDRNLEIALLVRDLLRIRDPGLEVIMTRETDEYVSLGSRTRLANSMMADLFVSIHCNAATNHSARGIETYFLSTARTDDARAVEMLENSVIELDDGMPTPQDPLAFLLADMAQNIYQDRSSDLAVAIQQSLAGRWPGSPDRGVKQAGFYVLRGALMPSVLVEVAFISNSQEEDILGSLDFRLGTAEAIVDAILSFQED